MHIFFDTEFSQFRGGQLLSVGLLAEDDRFMYVEIDDPLRRQSASNFCHAHVFTQFGLVAGSSASSDVAAGQRVGRWLESFDSQVQLCYDYNLDWRFLEQALTVAGYWPRLSHKVQERNIASEANHESALAAQEAYFTPSQRPGRHHALTDAYALRERWRAQMRLSGNAVA